MIEDKKSLGKWLEYYKKVRSDGCYTTCKGVVIQLHDDDRDYINKQIEKIEREMRDGS